ncbi:MAG TPA: prolyl oligopeptidase family serine peptidase [Gemmatimonadales bacterium]|nr:prolyl oligopeptidase family serine peptidase [Gemmatimonadales bacterium]
MISRSFIGAGALLLLALPAAGQAPVSSASSPAPGTPWKPAYTIDQFLSPASPLEVSAARKADRIAWVSYEKGRRNIYLAAAPDFRPVRITRFMADDGVDVGSVRLSDDGTLAIFVRGSAQNRDGWVANPSHDPAGGERSVWAARTDGTGAWRLASIANMQPGGRGGSPELSPDGRYAVFVKDGQIYRAATARGPRAAIDTGGVPFIKAWGRQSNPVWSPDGSRLAFVSARENHAFIGIYTMKSRTVDFMSPSTDIDGSPSWSPDGQRIAFLRRPGTPFGQQVVATQTPFGQTAPPAQGRPGGQGGAAPTGCRPPAQGGGGFGGGFGGFQNDTNPAPADGLCRAAFAGGYTIGFWVADVATGKARQVWHNQPQDRKFANIGGLTWAGDHLVFGAQEPNDEWDRFFSVSIEHPETTPVLLTTTDGLINDGVADRTFTTTALSRDGQTLFYSTNATDIEKRHIWAVPTAGGTPARISTDDGVEVSPTPLASGKQLAVLYFNAAQPASIGLVPAAGGDTRVVFPTLPKDFPKAAHVVPQIVITHAPDGLEVHNQLFLPKDLKPGEKRPAIVFVHGGPARQMLPAYHYMQFYHWSYAYNQWLQSQGYVVLSVNYRSGIGYGNSFRRAQNTQGRGNSEYQDVLAGAKYLQSRDDVDSTRVGIWGLSYGGLLTAEALARNSDVFVAGVDLAGVHIYGSASDTTSLAFRSSAVGHIDGWKSPVFLQQGDDDRNVDFSQMVGLVSLLRARNVYYELTVTPDDVHESLIHSRWMDIFGRSSDFLHRFVWEKQTPPGSVSSNGRN